MRLTDRDEKLIEDIALQQVMSRDQILALGYFGSVPRANARLGGLVKSRLLKRLELEPRLRLVCSIYTTTTRAREFVDPRVASLLAARQSSVRHLEHSLAVVDARIHLKKLGAVQWLVEPQARHCYSIERGRQRREIDIRPDGVALFPDLLVFVEVDKGSTSLARLKGRFLEYETYVEGGICSSVYGDRRPLLLVVTSGRKRAASILSQAPASLGIQLSVTTERDAPTTDFLRGEL